VALFTATDFSPGRLRSGEPVAQLCVGVLHGRNWTLWEVGLGDTLLMNVAAGGVGHIAIQLARMRGVERVFGLASEANHDFVRSLGAIPIAHARERTSGWPPR
jgi:NADPH:quinone reductase-like Zn-dependent oxidoreductase